MYHLTPKSSDLYLYNAHLEISFSFPIYLNESCLADTGAIQVHNYIFDKSYEYIPCF